MTRSHAAVAGEEELLEVPLEIARRQRGRPHKLGPWDLQQGEVPNIDSASFSCLRCGCCHGAEASLPVYCKDCFNYSLMYGFSDPTEDLALAHFMQWGRHLPGICEETDKWVLKLAPQYEI